MTDTPDKLRPAWQVEEVSDELQPAIDTYVILRRLAEDISRHTENELNKHGVTTAQYGVLLHMMRGEPLSLTQLSELVFRTNSTLTSLIDRMERDDLVVRAAHENDRRVTTVKPTPKGKELLLSIRELHRPFLADMMVCLSSEELTQLRELLKKVGHKVEEGECL